MKCKWSYYQTLDYDLFRIERFNDLLLTKAWKVKYYVMMDCAEPGVYHSLSLEGFVVPRKESTSLCNAFKSFFNARF